MIKFTLNDKVYDIPSSWDNVTIADFRALMKVVRNQAMYGSDLIFSLNLVSAVTKIPYEILQDITTEDFDRLQVLISWTNKMATPSDNKEFIIKGIKYIPITKFNELKMGEVISCELLIKDSEPDELAGNLMPILIRRATKYKRNDVPSDFDSKDYEDNKELFLHNLSIRDALRYKDFF